MWYWNVHCKTLKSLAKTYSMKRAVEWRIQDGAYLFYWTTSNKTKNCWTNKEARAVYYSVIKNDGYLRTRGKCRKHEPQVSVFYIFRVFSNVPYVIEVMWWKTIKHAFSYTLIEHRFLTNQSACGVLSML